MLIRTGPTNLQAVQEVRDWISHYEVNLGQASALTEVPDQIFQIIKRGESGLNWTKTPVVLIS